MNELPTMRCKGRCQDQCSIVPMTAAEVTRLQDACGRTFDVWPCKDRFTITPPGSMTCPALGTDGRCTGYEGRPILCRMWGMTKCMRCPHGCEPSRWLTDQEVGELLGIPLPKRSISLEEALSLISRARRVLVTREPA